MAASRFSRTVSLQGFRKERFAFCGTQPVANAPAKLGNSLHSPVAPDQFWAQ